MFGFRFAKFEPGLYVFKYKNGVLKKQGEGLSFWYFNRTTSIVAVPISSQETKKIETDTKAYALREIMKVYEQMDVETLKAIVNGGLDSGD